MENVQAGVCGLKNLKNSCYINSTLQCLFQIKELTDYFLNKDDIETQGELVKTYTELVQDIWSGKYHCISPTIFKATVEKFGSQFAGGKQADSHEFMEFLLTSLHKELKVVRENYNAQSLEASGSDQMNVKAAWNDYKKENHSIIINTFYGLFKSSVMCPECQYLSAAYEPFWSISLPVPDTDKKERQIIVTYEPKEPEKARIQIKLSIPNLGSIRDVCNELSQVMNIDGSKLIVTDIFNHRLFQIFAMEDKVEKILDSDEIRIYETILEPDNTKVILLCIYLREQIYSDRANIPTSMPSQPLFGNPMILAVPRDITSSELNSKILKRILPCMKLERGEHSLEKPKLTMKRVNNYGLDLSENLDEPLSFLDEKLIYVAMDWSTGKSQFF